MAIKIQGSTIIDDSRKVINASHVGIGTTNPTAELDVQGTVHISKAATNGDPHLTLSAKDSNGSFIIAEHASSYPDVVFKSRIWDGSSGSTISLFKGVVDEAIANSTFRSGIKLDDNKSVIFGTGGDAFVNYDPTPGVLEIKTVVAEPITVYTNDTERLRITSDGKVGIGTTNPTATLDVDGNANISGISTLGTVKISSGIVTAVSGVVTYYGDGSKLSGVTSGAIKGISILNESGNTVGTAGSITTLSFEGSNGVAVTGTTGAAGIATVVISGSGDINSLSDGRTTALSVGLGTGALANDDGTDNGNVAVGYSALHKNTSGFWNVAIGKHAMGISTSANVNVFIGRDAGRLVTNASSNAVVGSAAGYNLTSGSNHVFVGRAAGSQVTDGDNNTLVGYFAGGSSTISNSVAIGFNAGDNSSSDKATYVGNQAGYHHDGDENTFIGYRSGESDAGAANIGTGNSNTGVGYYSLNNLTSGSKNTTLGHNTGFGITNGSNNILIGYNVDTSSPSTSNEVIIGDLNITKFRIPGIGVTLKDNTSTPTEGHVLTVDANGEASFAALTLSNVDAATLDGIDSGSFLRSDVADAKTSGNLTFSDQIQAAFGASSDMVIEHDGTDNHITSRINKDLNIELESDGGTPKIYLRPTTNSQGITLGGGSGNPVELYYSNDKKFETTTDGFKVQNGALETAVISGPQNIIVDPSPDDVVAIVDGDISGANVSIITGITTTNIAVGNLIQEVDGVISAGTTVTSVGISQVGISKTSLGAASNQEFIFANQTPTGIVRIKGDLYVDGTTTEINSTTLTIDDLNIVVASGATNSTAADGAGLTVDGASATFQYAHTGTKWVANKKIEALGFATTNGTSSQFLKADGSVDSSTYITSADGGDAATLDGIDSLSFLRSDVADQKTTGDLRFNNNIGITFGGSDNSRIFHDGTDLSLDLTAYVTDFKIRDNTTERYTFTKAGKLSLVDVNASGIVTATGFATTNGTSSQFLKADGSVDTSTYLTSVSTSSIPNNAVTHGKYQQVATDTIIGRTAAGTGNVSALTAAEVRGIINVEDGADVTDATNVASAGAVMESDTTTASMSFVIDEDDMATNSNEKVPTQQSVKAYVDNNTGDPSYFVTNALGKSYTGIGTTSAVGIGTEIEIIPYDTQNNGTLSFEGSAGQLFSVTNNLTTGSIFSVNDVSGIPSIDVNADGTIQLAPFSSTELVGIGTINPTAKLHVNGTVALGSSVYDTNGTFGTNGQVLSNVTGFGVSWTTVSGGGGGIANVAADTNPQLGGTLQTNGNLIDFGDSSGTTDDRLRFGAGNDLQIWHNGSNSYITQYSDVGDLYLNCHNDDNDVIIQTDNGSGSTADYFRADGSTGESILYHYGTQKLATKSNGIAVSGNVERYDTLVGSASTTVVEFAVIVDTKSDHRYIGGSPNAYYLDGIESPFLTFTPGKTYRFDQSDSSNGSHPLRFYLDAAKTTEYTYGVTISGTHGTANAYVEIDVTDETPTILHYQCGAHNYMGNAAQTNGSTIVNGRYDVSPNNTVPVHSLSAIGTETNIDVALVPKGSGAFSLHIPDGTSTGGNKRGEYAVDLQLSRSNADNVAAGDYSFIGAGVQNKISTNSSGCGIVVGDANEVIGSSYYCAIVGGYNNIITDGSNAIVLSGSTNKLDSSTSAVIGGYKGTTKGIHGIVVLPASDRPLGTGVTHGAVQSTILNLARETADATSTVLSSDNTTASTDNQLVLLNNSAVAFKGTCIAGVTGAGNTKAWEFRGAIKRGANAASTTLVGSVIKDVLAYDAGAAAWDVDFTADTNNGALKVTVTGQAGTTIRWTCKIETTELAF